LTRLRTARILRKTRPCDLVEVQMMNLVTGATGLLGSHIVEQLAQRNEPVRALVRAASDLAWLRAQPVELVEGDVTDRQSLERACRGVDCVYHAAAQVGDWGPWDQFVRVTTDGTANILAAARNAGVKRFVHISSISAYGHVDGDGLVLDETAPLGQNVHRWSYYTRAKVIAEHLVWDAHHRDGLAATVIRPSWLYGPRDRATIGRLVNLIRTGRAKLIGSGENRMNLAYAGNVADGCVMAGRSDVAIGQAYNCSSDGAITQREFFDLLADSLGVARVTKRVPYGVAYGAGFVLECVGHLLRSRRPPMVTRYAVWLAGRRCFFETKKIREQLGWRPRVSYEEGIPLTVRWYLDKEGGEA
jgi:nucleoside-diphosphate-sugar epimerase